ncbi:MAG: cyclic-di-AMP receptor, partial [Clostridia bacterium]|nr:cyclic-di-AMP receptor [Clostridia bacterium]
KHSNSRKQLMPAADMGTGVYANRSIEVMVGGAAIFVLNVEHFEKV